MEYLGYSLESFVENIELPYRAKVTEGYYEAGDEEGNREFSNGEILEVRRLICPFVDFTFRRTNTGQETRITISTRNQDLRFRVVTEREAHGLDRPRVFHGVHEIIERWPNAIRSVSDHFVRIPGLDPSLIARDEELRLIRVISDSPDSTDVRLELKENSTKQLVQLPAGFTGSFYEHEDPRSYTLQELVDAARVERFLRLDVSDLDEKATQVRGLPRNFYGVLTMKKPQVLVEIARVLVRETTGEEYTGQPLLCPIDGEIRLTPRDFSYTPLPFETYRLSSLREEEATKRLPFVARIVGWTEETTILQNHMTKPGDHVVVYSRTSVDKVLAHGGGKYFLIPVHHKGSFKRFRKSTKELKEIKLGSLDTKKLPRTVQYFNTSEYRNTMDDRLPLTDQLILDRFVKAEPCVVASKLFGDVIGSGFHLPLRTKITIRMERRWRKSMPVPQQMSHLDNYSEEITEELYNEILHSTDYQSPREDDRKHVKEHLPPVVPPRFDRPNSALANRPQPSLPAKASVRQKVRKERTVDQDDDDDAEDYSYIEVRSVGVAKLESSTEEEINKGIVEIPVNGNISGFSALQMVFFLRENHAPNQTLSTWGLQGIDGMAFAKMTDDDLKKYGIANPVIQFFRDRSKMQLVLSHL